MATNIDIKELFAQFKALPRGMKVLAGIVLFDAVLFLIVNLAFSGSLDDRLAQLDNLRGQQTNLHQQIIGTSTQIGRLPVLNKNYQDAVTHGVLAPMDRNQLSNTARDLAVHDHLSSFTGPISPEKLAPVTGTKYQTATVDVDFQSGAMLDSDVVSFWTDLFAHLPSHYQILSAVFRRSVPAITPQLLDSIRSGQTNSLVDSTIAFHWVSLVPPTGAQP